MSKRKVELDVVLPSDAAQCAACTERLLASVSALPGVKSAHLDVDDAARPKLCLHYEPSSVRLSDLESLVDAAGGALKGRYSHLSTPAVGLRHERQARLVEGVLVRQPGVLHASVAFGSRRLFVEFDPTKTNRETLLAAASKAGIASYTESAAPAAAATEQDDHEHEHGGPFGERTELIFSLACGALTAIGWSLEKAGVAAVVTTTLFVLAYALGSWFTFREVIVALRARKFEIDFLMLLAAVGAAILGEWFEGALLLFLFTLGHGLEGYAMRRARNAIDALAKLVPDEALRIDDFGREEEVAVAELVVGDRILVKPNTRIPADGFVSAGSSSVNQAPITGESVPVDKRPVADLAAALAAPESLGAEHRLFAGTINGASALTAVVTKAASESTLARVVKMVAEAETQRSPTQQFTDRFERAFVPIILVGVGALLFAWVVVDEPFSRSFYRAMAVLVAASPCALAIATPSAVLAGVARAARAGVLVKGGSHLESLGLVRAIAFDKTGTLTEGKPRLTDVVAVDGASDEELLAVAVCVEKQSDHPLASAIVGGARAWRSVLPTFEASSVEAVVGYGVRATVAGSEVSIGKPGLFTRDGALPESVTAAVSKLLGDGRTVMVVRSGRRFLGVLGVMDTPRESAAPVVAQLHALGIEQTIMLTGDNQRVADAVAKHVGIRTARGDLLPEQKVAAIAELARSKSKVAMVGDGVNDAPAMANATVGIAMGAGGSDVALETADVALMADDLRALPFAVGLSRAARNIIRQNLYASLGMVAFLIPATLFGLAKIGVAVALHEGSTLLVVVNALRLLAYERAAGTRPAPSGGPPTRRLTMSKPAIRFEVQVQHLDSDDEAGKVEAALRGHDGVIEVRAFPKAGKVSLTVESSKTSREALEGELASLGFPVARDAERDAPGLWSPKVLASVTSGVLVAVGWVLARALPTGWPSLVALGLAILVGGYSFTREGLQKLIAKGVFGIEVLMSAAAIGAAALGEPLEAAMLVFLYSISEAAEGFTEQKTRAAVRALMKLVPKVALVRRDGTDVEVAVESLAVGDVFIVRPGESVATDGEVVRGETSIDQAPVTGESVPVKKAAGDEVFAGTINADGVIEVRATRTFQENTVAKIIHLVEEAQEQKGESQRFIERFGARYSPAVLVGGVLVAAVLVFALGFSWNAALHRAVVFIVAAAPCALVISVPITLVAALGTGARNGVLIKGGVILERLATIRTIALDKTGTLTRGEPVVTDFVRLDSSPHAESDLLSRVATIESRSEHPVARAIVAQARARGVAIGEATDVRALPGAGVVATIDGAEVLVGRLGLFESTAANAVEARAVVQRLEEAGKTVIVAGTSTSVWCVVAVQDAVREEASEAVRLLQARGVELIVLSGDQQLAVERVASTLGIKRFHGAMKPEDKLAEIRALAAKAPIAMVGDGVNDAPALAQATVGVAMGAAGTDVALETADVALMGDDLRRLAFALALARRTQQVVRQNLALSILVIGTLAVGAVAGVFSLPVAVLVHEISEFIVIGSGLRLLRAPSSCAAA